MALVIGQRMSRHDLDTAPVGSVAQAPNGGLWHNIGPGVWRSRSGRTGSMREGYNTLVSIGTVDTLAGFRTRFGADVRDTVAGWTPEHQRVAAPMLANLGIDRPSIIGSRVNHRSRNVPQGTIATYGRPTDGDAHGVFCFEDGAWRKVVGPWNDMADCGVCTVMSSPGDPGNRVEGDQEELIAQFKAAVWAMGQEAKQKYQWCSAYDQLLARHGIVDPDGMPDFGPWPDLVKGVEGRDELPDGAVLGVAKGDWGIFVKDAGEWRRVAGTRPLAAGTMHLMFGGEGALRIRNAEGIRGYLPDAAWVEEEDGTWSIAGWSPEPLDWADIAARSFTVSATANTSPTPGFWVARDA